MLITSYSFVLRTFKNRLTPAPLHPKLLMSITPLLDPARDKDGMIFAFPIWLISLKLTSSKLMYVATNSNNSTSFTAERYSTVPMCLSTDGHLGLFHLLAAVTQTAENRHLQVCL